MLTSPVLYPSCPIIHPNSESLTLGLKRLTVPIKSTYTSCKYSTGSIPKSLLACIKGSNDPSAIILFIISLAISSSHLLSVGIYLSILALTLAKSSCFGASGNISSKLVSDGLIDELVFLPSFPSTFGACFKGIKSCFLIVPSAIFLPIPFK